MNDQTNTSLRSLRSNFKSNDKPNSRYALRQKASASARLDRGADSNDENVENVAVNLRGRRTSKRLFGSQSIENQPINQPFEVPPVDEKSVKKRRHSLFAGDGLLNEEPPIKRRMKDCVFIELCPTGFEPNEEIVKFVAYHPTTATKIGNFCFPTNPNKKVAPKMSKLIGIEVDCGMMLFDNSQLVAYSDIRTILEGFVQFIESLNSDNIVLVYENRFQLKYIACVLTGFFIRFGLLQRVEGKIVGFVDCAQLFGGQEGGFDLDRDAEKFKSRPSADHHLFGRLEVLSKYYQANNAVQVEPFLKLENVKAKAANYYEPDRAEVIETENDDSWEVIMEEARTINETKDYLTTDELRGLYLLQKLKYQYILSKTYKPNKKFPSSSKPRKKTQKLSSTPGRSRFSSFSSDTSEATTNGETVPPQLSIVSESLPEAT